MKIESLIAKCKKYGYGLQVINDCEFQTSFRGNPIVSYETTTGYVINHYHYKASFYRLPAFRLYKGGKKWSYNEDDFIVEFIHQADMEAYIKKISKMKAFI